MIWFAMLFFLSCFLYVFFEIYMAEDDPAETDTTAFLKELEELSDK